MRRRSWPSILLATIALVLVIAVTVGWNVIFAAYADQALAGASTGTLAGYWMIVAVGDLCLVTVMVAIVLVMVAAIRRTTALRRQDAFIDRITHELRTPLAGLRLAIDTCLRRELSGPALREQFAGMHEDLERLNELVEHVIETGRLEHGQRHGVREACPVRPVVERSAARIRRRHGLGEEAISLDLDAAPIEIETDAVAFEEILLNLLDNAVKYGGEQPRIEIAARRSDDELELLIRDHGTGIERQELGRIFKRFQRGSGDAARRRPGTGLGLYIVHALARDLGGSVRATSDGAGAGSTFTVRLPIGGSRDG